jgi:hypothetical protein
LPGRLTLVAWFFFSNDSFFFIILFTFEIKHEPKREF